MNRVLTGGSEMITAKLWISNTVRRNEDAAEIVAEFARKLGITGKEYSHLGLLTEETLSMATQLLRVYDGELHLQETPSGYEIILEADVRENEEGNAAPAVSPEGFMAKIAEMLNCSYMFDSVMEMPENLAEMLPDYMSYGFSEADSETAWAGKWSLSAYRQNLLNHSGSDLRLDELEKSIVARLADEVTVGIYGQRIRLMISVLLQK